MSGALLRHTQAQVEHEVKVHGLKPTKRWSPRLDFVVGEGRGKTLIELALRQEGQGNGYLLPPRAGYFTKTVRKLVSFEAADTSHARYLVLIDRSTRPRSANAVIDAWLRWEAPRIGARGPARAWETWGSSFRVVYCTLREIQSNLIRPYCDQMSRSASK